MTSQTRLSMKIKIRNWLCFMLYAAVLAKCVTATSGLTIHPKVVHILKSEFVNVTCKSDRCAECEFNIIPNLPKLVVNDVKLYFNKTSHDQAHTEKTADGNFEVFSAYYHGGDLQCEECGIRLVINVLGQFFIGCRVRAEEKKEWEYENMVVHVFTSTMDQKTKNNNIALRTVLPGSDVNLKYTFDDNITNCSVYSRAFATTSQSLVVTSDKDRNKDHNENNVAWQDQLQRGYCDITIKGISEDASGLVWPTAVTETRDSTVTYHMNPNIIAVGRPPNSTVLAVNYTQDLAEGRTGIVTAKCTAKNGRPVANITWLLGDQIIRDDVIDDEPDDAWMWPWDLQSITQTIEKNISREDNGKELRCRVQHMAMKDVYASRSIIIRSKSLTSSGKPTKPHPRGIIPKDANKRASPSQQDEQEWTNKTNQEENRKKRGDLCPTIFGVTIGIIILVIVIFLLYAKIKKKWIFNVAGPTKRRLTWLQENDVYGCNYQHTEQQRQNEGTENISPDVCRQLDVDDNEPRLSIYTENPYAEIPMGLWSQGPTSEHPQP